MKIRSRLTLVGIVATVIPLSMIAGIAIWQARVAEGIATSEVSTLSMETNERIVAGVVAMVTSQQEVLEKKVVDDLAVTRDILARHGEARLTDRGVEWQATDQFTGDTFDLTLPELTFGETRIEKNTSRATRSPIVDEVQDLVGGTATIFQRMNAEGDMLRVSTNVLTADDRRAIGTFIPATNPDGSTNAVVGSVLDGRRFVGRAFVVNAWYITAYEPIYDARGEVIGMLYAGVPQQSAQSLRRQILETKVGETGYVFVLDSSGDYVISRNAERDGENIAGATDADGRRFISEMIDEARALRPGEFGAMSYPWQNPGDPEPRMKTVNYAYFEPWDWIIGAGTYDEEFMRGVEEIRTVNETGRLVMLAVSIGALLAVVVAWLILSGRISKPIVRGVTFAQTVAQGDLDAKLDIERTDEIGTLADALRGMLASLREKAAVVERVAAGDLSVDVQLASEADGLGRNLRSMVDSLNEIVGDVRQAGEQVSSGSQQIAASSQSLSQGATQSASSVQEISASLTQINTQLEQTTASVGEAQTLSQKAATDARSGQERMNELRESMDTIGESSDAIGKVAKVIDDIAFQINLLALNANVEAARAGKYGKGFAVVAEEVRNLAVRSGEAVKETTAIVEQSLQSIGEGTEKSKTTAAQLEEIVSGSVRVAEVLEEIANASREQAGGVRQINEGLGQVDDVTQATTAEAEESAAASEELSGQAEQLRNLVGKFILRGYA